MAVEKVDMDGLIDYLIVILGRRFSKEVSRVYYGDIGVYLPSSFGGSRNDQKCVIAIQPAYNHQMEQSRTAAGETRLLGVDIIVMVNITPFFEANPSQAYGEQMLVRLATEIAQYLSNMDNVQLGGRVEHSAVGDIDWAWMAKDKQAIRGAGIAYEARVRINRN